MTGIDPDAEFLHRIAIDSARGSRSMMTRGFLPLLAIVAATGIAALAWETDGFRVVTSAGARQLSIERTPLPLPDVRLVDQDGHAFSLSSYKGRPVLVDFI